MVFDLDVWDTLTGKIRFTARMNETVERMPASAFIFNTDGTRLFAASFSPFGEKEGLYPFTVDVWDTQTGKLVRSISTSGGHLTRMIAGNQNSLLVLQNGIDNQVWDVDAGKMLLTVPAGQPYLSRDGKNLWLARPGFLELHELASGKKIQSYAISATKVISLIMSLDETRAVLKIQNGSTTCRMVVIDLSTGADVSKDDLDRSALEFIQSGNLILNQDLDGMLNVYDGGPDHLVQQLALKETHVLADSTQAADPSGNTTEEDAIYIDNITASPASDYLLSVVDYNLFRFWNLETGGAIRDMAAEFDLNHQAEQPISISPDGTIIAVAGEDGIIRLWGGEEVV